MKKIYLVFTALLFGFNSKAQVTLTNAFNAPIVGDARSMSKYDSTTAVPKATGAGLNWNFNSLTSASSTENITYTTVSLPNMQAFSNLQMSRNGSNPEFYDSQSGSLSIVGMYDNSATALTNFTGNKGVWINWPTSFGNSNSDTFAGTEISMTFTNNWNGVVSYTASGSGTVVLPNGNTYNNCLQIKRLITATITGTQPSTITMISYEYYSGTRKFPIITIEYQSQQTGTGTSKSSSFYVDAAALPVGVNEMQLENSNFIVYPNPASNLIKLLLPGNAVAEKIELIDVTGRLVLSANNVNSLNTSSIAKGIYLVKVQSGNSAIQKQVIITE